ncbi:histidine phosphatase family protein [Bacillus sp. Y1]|nr:histidine phosphatase family protein [Bacillus sp. Y1]AYA74443.1 histidine phosphatase family protein [Bacillus sp. Y1]
MKVGLVRHFKVTHGYPKKYITAEELVKWEKEYNESNVEEKEIELSQVKWEKCFSSDLPRARITAERYFDGIIIYLEELREVALSPFFQKKIRLPLFIHILFIRFAWLVNHKSQQEKKSDVLKRVNKALDLALQSGENVLIISHGGIMLYMSKELEKRGFRGPKFRRPENGVLYTFVK